MMVSSNIRRAREKKGMSQAKLALALGVKENTVWRWENNKSTPNASTIVNIADVLDSTPAELLSAKNPEQVQQTPVQQEHKPTDFAYWGSILNETRNAIDRGDAQEISLIEIFLNSAREMIIDSRKQEGPFLRDDLDKSGQHFNIHNNTMKAKNINVGTMSESSAT